MHKNPVFLHKIIFMINNYWVYCTS